MSTTKFLTRRAQCPLPCRATHTVAHRPPSIWGPRLFLTCMKYIVLLIGVLPRVSFSAPPRATQQWTLNNLCKQTKIKKTKATSPSIKKHVGKTQKQQNILEMTLEKTHMCVVFKGHLWYVCFVLPTFFWLMDWGLWFLSVFFCVFLPEFKDGAVNEGLTDGQIDRLTDWRW